MLRFISLLQYALVTFFLALPTFAFGQVVVDQTTSYSGMSTTTTIALTEVATIIVAENRDNTGSCQIAYAEGDIPPHKMKAIQGLEKLCSGYNRAQVVAAKLAREFGITHYQALKVSLESAFRWPEHYQINPTNGLTFEVKKVARRYLRAKKKAEKKAMKKRLIRHALTTRSKETK